MRIKTDIWHRDIRPLLGKTIPRYTVILLIISTILTILFDDTRFTLLLLPIILLDTIIWISYNQWQKKTQH